MENSTEFTTNPHHELQQKLLYFLQNTVQTAGGIIKAITRRVSKSSQHEQKAVITLYRHMEINLGMPQIIDLIENIKAPSRWKA